MFQRHCNAGLLFIHVHKHKRTSKNYKIVVERQAKIFYFIYKRFMQGYCLFYSFLLMQDQFRGIRRLQFRVICQARVFFCLFNKHLLIIFLCGHFLMILILAVVYMFADLTIPYISKTDISYALDNFHSIYFSQNRCKVKVGQ